MTLITRLKLDMLFNYTRFRYTIFMEKRCFVSIDLPLPVKEYLAAQARPDIYWIKWIKQGNLHITLNFLGDLNGERITEAQQVLEGVSAASHSFTIKLSGPELHQDMLWVVPEKNETLIELQDALKSRLKSARLGKRERRSFAPHILLGKSKTGRNMRPVIKHFQPQEFLVDHIHLYESELTPGTATHRLIQSFPLTPAVSPPHEGGMERGSG